MEWPVGGQALILSATGTICIHMWKNKWIQNIPFETANEGKLKAAIHTRNDCLKTLSRPFDLVRYGSRNYHDKSICRKKKNFGKKFFFTSFWELITTMN